MEPFNNLTLSLSISFRLHPLLSWFKCRRRYSCPSFLHQNSVCHFEYKTSSVRIKLPKGLCPKWNPFDFRFCYHDDVKRLWVSERMNKHVIESLSSVHLECLLCFLESYSSSSSIISPTILRDSRVCNFIRKTKTKSCSLWEEWTLPSYLSLAVIFLSLKRDFINEEASWFWVFRQDKRGDDFSGREE